MKAAGQVYLTELVGTKVELCDPVGLAHGFGAGNEAFAGVETGDNAGDLGFRE